MSHYAWPAEYYQSGIQWTLRFPDWPDITVVSLDWSDALRQAAHLLSVEVNKRIDMKSRVPSQSELGPNRIPILLDAATSARLERYLKDQNMESLREANELLQSTHLRRAAFLTDYKASTEPIERLRDAANRIAAEYAAIAVRFGYILNAGGLVAVPAIMELLPEPAIDRSFMIFPAVLFAAGILSAAVTNYLAYRSSFKTGEAWADELNVRAGETRAIHYPPKDEAESRMEISQHRAKHESALKSSLSCANWGVGIFGLSIVLFLSGVVSAILGMMHQ